MNYKELIEWLKMHLIIQLEKDYGYYNEESLIVSLRIDEEVISRDSIRIN